MLCNTYNGQAYKSTWVRDVLEEMGLVTTALTPLKTDTGIVFGALDQKALDALSLSPQAQLMAPMVELGFHQVIPIDPAQVVEPLPFGPALVASVPIVMKASPAPTESILALPWRAPASTFLPR